VISARIVLIFKSTPHTAIAVTSQGSRALDEEMRREEEGRGGRTATGRRRGRGHSMGKS
jgi:hypothetical protein